MKPSVYQCEVCGVPVAQTPGAGRLKRFCGKKCRDGRYYVAKPPRLKLSDEELARRKVGRRRRYRQENLEAARRQERERQRRPEVRARVLEYNREWRRNNPERLAAQRSRYRSTHPNKDREWRRANPEKRREYNRKWAAENPEVVRASSRATYWRDPERGRARRKVWQEENAEYVRQLQRAWRDDVERVVTPRAINGRAPWTDAELQIALDRNLSLAEAALRLGRTVTAISQKRYRARQAAS